MGAIIDIESQFQYFQRLACIKCRPHPRQVSWDFLHLSGEQQQKRDPIDIPREHEDQRIVLNSDELFQGRNEVWIEHEGQTYRLRLTRSGKLILHK